MNTEEIIKKIQSHPQKKVRVAITDIDGILRGKYINIDKFTSASKLGFGFCNVVFGWDLADVCYDNIDYTGWHTGYPDAQAKIDFSTYRETPWDEQTSFFLADFYDHDDKPLNVCPRQVLKKVIAKAHNMGYFPYAGLEFEWFNFKESPQSLEEKNYQSMKPITPGMFGYSLLRANQNREYFQTLMNELQKFGVPLEGLHTETGPGVYEAAIIASEPLEAADRGVLLKASVKDIAHRFDILPSFMAKWNETLPGCSGHIHQSLLDKNGNNVFFDSNDSNQMSELFKHYLAGQMYCLTELLPLWAPTVNSYKRLVEGLWAPTKVTWGVENRTSALRVIPAGKKSTRLETRLGGADFNPYLALAASLASGLYGIEKKLKLETLPIQGNAYEAKDAPVLSGNLLEATKKMHQSTIARELFDDSFIEHFTNTRMWEWRQFQKSVTNWEIQRYFEII